MAVNDRPGLHMRSVVEGAGLVLLIGVPPIVLVRLLKSDDVRGEESNLWVVAVVVLLVAFALGGYRVARLHRLTPFMHSAATGAVAFGCLSLVAFIRRLSGDDGITAEFVIGQLLLAQICVSIALLGGYVAVRRRAGAGDTA